MTGPSPSVKQAIENLIKRPNDIFMDDGIFQSAKIILLWILNQFLPSLKENRSTEGWNGGLQKDVSMVLLPQHS